MAITNDFLGALRGWYGQRDRRDGKRGGRLACAIILFFSAHAPAGQAPAINQPLPSMDIKDRGELLFENDRFFYRPWSTDHNPGKVHIVQYFAATMKDSEIFAPFTDRLQDALEPDSYHVTTIINLDAALWGTTGFAVSEIKANKREFPLATMVLDEEGRGAVHWQLGNRGAGLAILDRAGIVNYFTREALSEEEIKTALDLVTNLVKERTGE
jgi:YtfJ family uncharacterized protein